MTRGWPALWPPWKRTTPCARSVSQSTILPLPSSPHWVPMTTTLRAFAAMRLFHHAGDAAQIDREAGRGTRATERLAHFVVASAARHGPRDPGAISVEHHAGVIVIAAQLREVEADRNRAALRERAQRLQRLRDFAEARQAF